MDDLAREPSEMLESFCQDLDLHGLWEPQEDIPRIEEARLVVIGSLDDEPDRAFELRAKRYHNFIGQALKISFWEHIFPNLTYVGAIGYHNLLTPPYSKVTQPDYSEARLYIILGAATLIQ